MGSANIDQQTRRRLMRHGLTAYDPERATAGYVLFTPAFSPGTVFLLDHHGEEVHRWDVPYRPGLSAYLDERQHAVVGAEQVAVRRHWAEWAGARTRPCWARVR